MKHYTIKINNEKNNTFNFRTNASKALDDLILSNMKKMNPYLGNKNKTTFIKINKKYDTTLDAMFAEAGFDTSDSIIIPNLNYSYLLKDNFDIEFIKAAKFLSSYSPKTTTFKLYNNDDIAFFEDEIQIGNTLIPLYKLENSKYYNTFTPAIKNTIINIFITINR